MAFTKQKYAIYTKKVATYAMILHRHTLFLHAKFNPLPKDRIMTEEKNRMKVWPIQKDCVSLHENQVCPDFFDILKTKQRASFSYNGNLRNSTYKKRRMSYSCFRTFGRGLLSYSVFKVSQDLHWKNMG